MFCSFLSSSFAINIFIYFLLLRFMFVYFFCLFHTDANRIRLMRISLHYLILPRFGCLWRRLLFPFHQCLLLTWIIWCVRCVFSVFDLSSISLCVWVWRQPHLGIGYLFVSRSSFLIWILFVCYFALFQLTFLVDLDLNKVKFIVEILDEDLIFWWGLIFARDLYLAVWGTWYLRELGLAQARSRRRPLIPSSSCLLLAPWTLPVTPCGPRPRWAKRRKVGASRTR